MQKINCERSVRYHNPHLTSDGSCTEDPDLPGSFRVPIRALNIIWGNDTRFWRLMKFTEEESRSTGFTEGLNLRQVNWIEVTAKVPTLCFYATKYEIFYIVKFQVDAFGWHSVPIKFKVRLNGDEQERRVILESYRAKHEVWHELPGGEFTISSHAAGNLQFGMFETESDWWKGSMILAGIKIKPKPDGAMEGSSIEQPW